MERPCLNNPDEFPDDTLLARHLGPAKTAWDSFMTFLRDRAPDWTGQWRYYNDGKTWLFKLTHKKKTLCWVSIWPGAFKTTFYFGIKAAPLIAASKLPQKYIDQFLHGKTYGKIRSISVLIKTPAALSTTKTLLRIKEQLK
jgi:hypothetical protein